MLSHSLTQGTRESWGPRDRGTATPGKEQGHPSGHMLSHLGSFCPFIFSASLQKSAKGVYHTSCRSNTVLGLGACLLIPSRAKNRLKRRKLQPTSTACLPHHGSEAVAGWRSWMGVGCGLLPAWAPDTSRQECSNRVVPPPTTPGIHEQITMDLLETITQTLR